MSQLIKALKQNQVEEVIKQISNGDIKDLNALYHYHQSKFKYVKESLLHFASVKGHLQLVKILIARGAQVDIWDSHHVYCPIHLAAENGHLEIVEVI